MSPEDILNLDVRHEYWTKFTFKTRSSFSHPPHFHESIEIVFVMDGVFKTVCDGTEYKLTAGSVLLCGSNSIHYSTDFAAESNSILLIVNPKALLGSASQLTTKTPVCPIWKNPKKDSIIWADIQYALHNQAYLSSDDLALLLSSIISLIIRDMEMVDMSQKEKTEHKVLQYCSNHYTEAISVKSVAEALSISESYVSYIFNNVLGYSFPQHINNLRIEQATQLLKTTKKSCTQIALECGFSTLRTFNRVFLQKHNITPLQYRKKMSRLADIALENSTTHSTDVSPE